MYTKKGSRFENGPALKADTVESPIVSKWVPSTRQLDYIIALCRTSLEYLISPVQLCHIRSLQHEFYFCIQGELFLFEFESDPANFF
jgi:hypothetical protein